MTFGLIPTPVPEQLNKEITARQAAEERAQARQDSRREQPVTLIERLKGQAGEKDFSLIEAMELENDTGAYLEILCSRPLPHSTAQLQPGLLPPAS
ncbi:hypothetical protein HYDPIDRAFT_29249 [Hydnomerulius pinastri MD-312]|uniref:Uncharacterized protein n=1 Tax=Hydnomerulius pinastri MD-312 TaxID=994086 RepID=A0A0C9VEA9_9AGAM|nr:hypothetical protein HYDPIDRAFT_29249 [Hydnomerulius pinastri MD-312]